MGLSMELLWPFMNMMLVFSVVGSIVFVIINKMFMYHGPEDEEIWELGKDYFTINPEDKR